MSARATARPQVGCPYYGANVQQIDAERRNIGTIADRRLWRRPADRSLDVQDGTTAMSIALSKAGPKDLRMGGFSGADLIAVRRVSIH